MVKTAELERTWPTEMARQATLAWRRRLDARDVSGLESFGALIHFELDGFALVQAPVSRLLNRREVHEHILASRALNKTVALGSIEPLHCAFFSHNLLLSHELPEMNSCFAEAFERELTHARRRFHVAGKQGCRSARSFYPQ